MTRRDTALLMALGALWGAVFPLASIVLRELPPLAVVVARTGLSAMLLVPLALRGGVLVGELRRRPVALLTASVLQMTLPIVLLTIGQQHVSAGLAGILLGTQPVWATLLVGVADRRVAPLGAAGVFVGLTGVVLLFWKDLGDGSAPFHGALLITAAAGYAAGGLYIQRALPDAPPVTVAATALTLSCLLLAPALVFTPIAVPSPATAGWLIVLGTAATGGALVLFYVLIGRVGVVRANLAAYLAPAFALLYDVPLGHLPTASAVAGLALILFGSVMAAGGPVRPSSGP
ncbi:DMT family transporter [Streptomyces scopuliridis]|uniref:DMT family transporter n=1 Tax=Streptomyces scopuliridis TaxID=452529 RepID=A0ACD4ZUL8_9ACTN|nr:DMT family transporter [Streptomyces scopuliridis]WSC01712.1 DMT family transporter [Streptomyces scopuliridis]WSC04749.1 DMT family transporter [Streptomyces scopuliridis]